MRVDLCNTNPKRFLKPKRDAKTTLFVESDDLILELSDQEQDSLSHRRSRGYLHRSCMYYTHMRAPHAGGAYGRAQTATRKGEQSRASTRTATVMHEAERSGQAVPEVCSAASAVLPRGTVQGVLPRVSVAHSGHCLSTSLCYVHCCDVARGGGLIAVSLIAICAPAGSGGMAVCVCVL